MIGRTNTSGGGGGGLNYKIIGGTTEPSNPKENTIWIKTDAKITSHIFSAKEPEGWAEGMVWIQIGEGSNVSFNALKANSIVILPVAVSQYVDGGWVRLDSSIYQAGTWVKFAYSVLYLYNNGDSCDGVHGGWVRSTRMYATNKKTPTLSFGTTEMTATISGTTKNFQSGCIETQNGVDITKYNKITFVVTGFSLTNTYGSAKIRAGVSDDLSTTTMSFDAYVPITKKGTYELDISNLSGVHDIVVFLQTDQGSGNKASVTISEIVLE